MASTQAPPHTHEDTDEAPTESEPLLGRPGDAIQKTGAPMLANLYLGTGWIAQVGAVLLVALVGGAVFTHPLVPLFSPHPLLQSVGVLTLVQAVLVPQPTVTPAAKAVGARAHAALNLLSFLLFAGGVIIIEVNKQIHGAPHFKSTHGILGVATAVLLLAQYLFGFFMWGVPGVLGGIDKAKMLWKYHRASGYLLLLLLLITVVTASGTSYNHDVLGIKLWSLILAVLLMVVGIAPRIQLAKFGFRRAH